MERDGIYLDNAATSHPKPEAVYRAVEAYLRHCGANPGRSGHRPAVEAAAVMARARQALAALLHVPDPNRIVWTPNATNALNLALRGLLRPGDRVVTTGLEHNAVARPLRELETRGVEVRRVPCPGGEFDLDAFIRALTPGTRLAAMVHASNVTGAVLPAREAAIACRERGILFLLDAAQTAGSLPLDLRALPADLVAMPGHKGLLGPTGTGALYAREGVEPEPLTAGGTGSVSESDAQPEAWPERHESGTQNVAGVAGLGAALEWILETGVERIHAREQALVERLRSGLAELPGVRVLGPAAGAPRAAALSVTLEGWDPAEAAAVLDETFGIRCRAGLHCAPWAHASLGTAPTGTLRFSPGYFNTETEIDAAVAAVRRMCHVA